MFTCHYNHIQMSTFAALLWSVSIITYTASFIVLFKTLFCLFHLIMNSFRALCLFSNLHLFNIYTTFIFKLFYVLLQFVFPQGSTRVALVVRRGFDSWVPRAEAFLSCGVCLCGFASRYPGFLLQSKDIQTG